MPEDKLTAAMVAAVSPLAHSLHPCRFTREEGGAGSADAPPATAPDPRRRSRIHAHGAQSGGQIRRRIASRPQSPIDAAHANIAPVLAPQHHRIRRSSSSSLLSSPNHHRCSSSSPSHHRNRLAATPHPLITVAVPPLCTRNHKSSLIRKMWRGRGKSGWTVSMMGIRNIYIPDRGSMSS
uniref:Uncharacterized protein n=1 Tax=Oryza rufipogon TaxID=4529 RepID=A0A0E0QX24_ORYRU